MPHPNALAGGAAPGLVGAVIWALSIFGVHIPDPPLEVGVWIGGAASVVVLAIGRRGIRGIARLIWRGAQP